MTVTLLHHTPLWIVDKAIGKCWNKPTPDVVDFPGMGISSTRPGCNTERIERVANKHKHASTIEHLSYNFDIDGISRALLQELARHRMASLSVKSSRYTLKELKDVGPKGVVDFFVPTNNVLVDSGIKKALWNVQDMLNVGISNDIVKYALPESYKTSLVWTINARSLQNFLALRTSKAALWEIRDLANEVYNALPEDHKFLFTDSIQS